jgi:ABC-type uncharacterized transport system substrate-binding protein
LLHDLIPNAVLFGVLVDPGYSVTQSTVADLQAAARTLGLQLIVVNARTDSGHRPSIARSTTSCCGPADGITPLAVFDR